MNTDETQVASETDSDNEWGQTRVAQSIVHRHTALAAGAGVVPVPVYDIAGLLLVQLNMIKRLCDLYDDKFSRSVGKNVFFSLAGTALPYSLRYTGYSILKAIPGLGSLAGAVTMPTLNASFTYALGKVLIRHYESGGTLLDFDAKKAQSYFHEKLEEGAGSPA